MSPGCKIYDAAYFAFGAIDVCDLEVGIDIKADLALANFSAQ
jgi:hypothetical protein